MNMSLWTLLERFDLIRVLNREHFSVLITDVSTMQPF